jgi:hypothetical protein
MTRTIGDAPGSWHSQGRGYWMANVNFKLNTPVRLIARLKAAMLTSRLGRREITALSLCAGTCFSTCSPHEILSPFTGHFGSDYCA